MRATAFLAAFGMGAWACASVQIPAERWTAYDEAARVARDLGALDVPDAKRRLDLAADEWDAARRYARAGDERAATMLARAEADADLAVALTREALANQQAAVAAARLRAAGPGGKEQVVP